MKERDVNVDVCNQLINILRDKNELAGCLIQGVGVNTDASVSKKIKYANSVIKENQFNPDEVLYISVHCNAASNKTASGVEIWTPNPHGSTGSIANSILSARLRYFPELKDRGIKNSTGARAGYINSINCRSMLIELAFISNEGDRAVLKQTYRNAESIANGLLEYIRNKLT